LAYSLAIPLFEAPDEQLHVLYVRHLAEGRGLPVQRPSLRASYAGQESSQPPLYYALGALLVAGRDLSALREDVQDVFAAPGLALSVRPGGPRERGAAAMFSHDPALERWPYGEAALAVRLVRLLSLALGAMVVAAVYATARAVWPARGSVALLAAALAAFDPQFVFVASVVNNDNLLNATAAAALWLAVRLALGEAPRRAWWGLGAALGVGLLAKFSALALLALAGATAVLAAARERSAAPALRALPALLLPPLLLAGWWFARNVALYGEPFGWPTHLASFGPSSGQPVLAAERWAEHAWLLVASGWLAFGWMNVWAPLWFYLLFGALALASAGGWAFVLAQPRRRAELRTRWPAVALLAGWGALIFILLLAWVSLTPAGRQGRLLFPALAAYATLGAYGLVGWLPERYARPVAVAVAVGMALLALWAYAAVLVPAYA
ncbi:MAG: glycosyltransferase family 39 protein, partial [Chloroflexi bacterium]|nr:glycosyltransferase family 39 protein [Chloroflexota bacterium]